MDKLSILIPAFNNEEIITDCLESAKWADEIFVVDSFSTDRTLEICKQYTNKVIQHEYINSATQKNWAIPQMSHPWVMVLDTDERITPELREEIQGILKDNKGYVGFRIRRINSFFGKQMNGCGWDKDWVLRIFKKDLGRYLDREVHADVVIKGKIGELENCLIHNSYTSMEQYVNKFQRYTSWLSLELQKKGVKVKWYHILFRPIWRFFKMYILQRGFTQGIRGLILSWLGMMSVFMKYAKLWDKQRDN